MKKAVIVFSSVFIVFLLFAVDLPLQNKIPPKNNMPVVKIITPKNESWFDGNANQNYSITVSDKEDGESKYDEINTKEVLLQVTYLGNNPKLAGKGLQSDPPGLAIMRTSNCFNCHTFNARAIGPSFYEIVKKYPATNSNIALLVKRIREGSSGIWDKVSMPTHTELTVQQTQSMVKWIMQNAADPDNSYYTGIEGAFRIPPHSSVSKNAAYRLTASYTDHGAKDDSTHRLKGQDVVIIHSK